MKKIDKKLREFVVDQCQKSAWNIGVSHYEIDIFYMKDDEKGSTGGLLHGEMDTDRRYLKGTLKLYPVVIKMWEDGKKKQVKEVIHHEIAHLATQHLFDVATATYRDEGEMKDAWETLTTVIGRMSLLLDEYKQKQT